MRSRDADLHVAKARRRGAVRDRHDLARLALATVRQPPGAPLLRPAHRVERAPEPRADPGVGGVAVQPPEPAALDLARELGRELELQAAVVDRPRAVRLEVQAVVGVGDEVLEAARAPGLDRDVRHPDDRLAGEAVGARAAARALEPDRRRRLAVGQRGAEYPAIDEGIAR